MLRPDYLQGLPDSLVELYAQAEADILADMARRISDYDFWIPAAEHQRKVLIEMGASHDYVLERLSDLTNKTKSELQKLFLDAGNTTMEADGAVYRAAGLTAPALDTSEEMQNVLKAGLRKTRGLFENLSRTTANTASGQFERALDRAYMQVTSGAFDVNTAVRTAVKDLARQGVGAVEYPGRPESLEAAVRRAVVTGVNQTSLQLQDELADEMGCDLVETTAHGGARPEHAVWQGKIFSRSGKHPKYPDFVKETGYGTGAGLGGWNCRHSFFPYFEGSPRAYTDKTLQDYETKKYTYNGQKMTEYEATQTQRHIERQIRRWKREFCAMDAAGLDTGEAAAKVARWQKTQRDFIAQTGLKRQYDREQISSAVAKLSERGIIKLTPKAEDRLSQMPFSEVSQYAGKLSDRAVRKWYKYHDEQIPSLIDRSLSVEEQARQACDLRNQHRTHARDLMRDQEARKRLDETDPNRSFEELVADKMQRKGLTREQAYEDILKTATKTRKSVNRKFGLEE